MGVEEKDKRESKNKEKNYNAKLGDNKKNIVLFIKQHLRDWDLKEK